MKKYFIIILLSFSMGAAVKAQDLTFGLKAGLNCSNVWDEEGQDFVADSKLGFAGGGFLRIPFLGFLGFQPEILFSQKGLQASGTLMGSSYFYTKTTNWIDIPLQLQIRPIDQLTFLAGPQYSYLLSEKTIYTYGANSTEQESEFENDNYRRNILGAVAGVDINISHVVISGRMGWDFQTNHGDGSSSTPRYKNSWVQLTVGFKI